MHLLFLFFFLQVTSKFAVLFITVQYNVTISTNGKLCIKWTVWCVRADDDAYRRFLAVAQCFLQVVWLKASHLDSGAVLAWPYTNPFENALSFSFSFFPLWS